MTFSYSPALRPATLLFNHLVSSGKKARRNCKANHLGGLKVDNQIKLCCLEHRQVGWLIAFENATNVNSDLSERVGKIS
jgi:hypothetical protein